MPIPPGSEPHGRAVASLGDGAGPQPVVHVSADGDVVTLAVEGRLDDDAGRLLLELAASAASGAARGVEIDLAGVQGFTSDGAEALARCRRIARGLPAGLRYRAQSLRGREVLLAACIVDD